MGATVGAETGAVVAKHLSQVFWQYPSGASAVGMVMKAAWQLPAILCNADMHFVSGQISATSQQNENA